MNPRVPLPILAALGANVRTNRNALKLSQMRLAEMAGLHRTYIADVERGSRNPSLISMARISQALSMSVSDLCRGIDDQSLANDRSGLSPRADRLQGKPHHG